MSSTSTGRQSRTEYRDALRLDTNPFVPRLLLPFERPHEVLNEVPPILNEYQNTTMDDYEKKIKELKKTKAKPPTTTDEHKRIMMALIERIPEMWSGMNKQDEKLCFKEVAFDTYIRTGIPIAAMEAKNYFTQVKNTLRDKLCESIQRLESPSETEITLNQWPKYHTIRFFRKNLYKSEIRMRAEVTNQVIDLENCRDFPDRPEDDITTRYSASNTSRANFSIIGADSSTIGANSSNRHVDADDERIPENGPVDRHVPTPAQMEDIVIERNHYGHQNAREPSVFDEEYEMPQDYDRPPYQPRVRQQFASPAQRYALYSTQRAPNHNQTEQLQQGQIEGNAQSPKTMSSTSTFRQPKIEQRDPLRPDTKPLIHKVTPPFERPNGRVNEVPQILDEFQNAIMPDYDKKIEQLEKTNAEPPTITDEQKRIMMALIERIPEMWSGKSSQDQNIHYRQVAFDTYIRTGLPITAKQVINHFRAMKENLRRRLRKSINNLESPSETEITLNQWSLYYTIRFFRRNNYHSEVRMRAEVAHQVIDLENCGDFPDYIEDDITTGDIIVDTSTIGANSSTNGASSSTIGTDSPTIRANSSTIGANSSNRHVDADDERIPENDPVDRGVSTLGQMENIAIERNHYGHQNAREPSVFNEDFETPQYYDRPPYQPRVRQQFAAPAHRFSPYPMQRAPAQQLQQGMPRRSGGYNQSNTQSPVPVVPNPPSQSQHALAISGMAADLTRVANKLTDEKYGVMMKVMHDIVYAAEFEEFDNPATLLRTLMYTYERH